MLVSADPAACTAEDVVRHCWTLIAHGQPFEALDRAERALRAYDPPADSMLSGRLLLVVGVSLQALGRHDAARRYLADASWALERARAAGEWGAAVWTPVRGDRRGRRGRERRSGSRPASTVPQND